MSLVHKSEFSEGPIIGSTLGYKVYTALLTQSGTGAPTVTVLQNTIGTIVWSRVSIGSYKGTLTGVFTSGKTFYNITYNNNAGGGGSGEFLIYEIRNDNINAIQISTLDVEMVTHLANPSDSLLSSTPIEIRIYP